MKQSKKNMPFIAGRWSAIDLGISRISEVTIYDLIPDVESYMYDVALNIGYEPGYCEMRDILGDFGTFPAKPNAMPSDVYHKLTSDIIEYALVNHGYKL